MPNSMQSGEPPWLRVRREPFEFGLLPLPSLVNADAVNAFKTLRSRLLAHGSGSPTAMAAASSPPLPGNRVSSATIAACLGLTEYQGRLVVETIASILPDEGMERDILAATPVPKLESVGVDLEHFLLFLYLQLYKRLPHRSHRDAASIGDVWPSSSPFDGFAASPSSPLQLKTSNSGRHKLIPQYAEEEQHQLHFIQKHLGNILTIVAGEDAEGLKVISSDKLERLGILLRAGGSGAAAIPLSQAAPFFANSDPAMPAVPVPVSQVQEWLSRVICATSDHGRSTTAASGGGGDVNMADAGPSGNATPSVGPGGSGSSPFGKDWWPEGMTCIDGVTKMSVLKGENDIEGGVVRTSHCHDSVVYVLAPLKYASVIGCTDSIIVLGAVGKTVKVENCERVQVIAPCARIRTANCRDCVFYLGTNTNPLVLGDNHNLQVAPYNTFYPRLDAHLAMCGVTTSVNHWDSPMTLGMDLHDPNTHPGAADTAGEKATLLPPERFVPFVVPFRSGGGGSAVDQPQTRANPFPLPKLYLAALQHKTKAVESLRQTLKTAVLEENKKRELTNVIQAHFKEWLFASGNIRQVYDLARLDRDP